MTCGLLHPVECATQAVGSGRLDRVSSAVQTAEADTIGSLSSMWAAWVLSGIRVAGVFVIPGRMAMTHNRSADAQHMADLANVPGARLLTGASSTLSTRWSVPATKGALP